MKRKYEIKDYNRGQIPYTIQEGLLVSGYTYRDLNKLKFGEGISYTSNGWFFSIIRICL